APTGGPPRGGAGAGGGGGGGEGGGGKGGWGGGGKGGGGGGAVGGGGGGSGAGGERLQEGGVARDDDRVARVDPGVLRRVLEGLAGGLHPEHGDAVPSAELCLAGREPVRLLRRAHLDDGEAVLHLDVVEHPAGAHVRHPLPGVVLGVDDVVGADPPQDPLVLGRCRLRPDLRHLHV